MFYINNIKKFIFLCFAHFKLRKIVHNMEISIQLLRMVSQYFVSDF